VGSLVPRSCPWPIPRPRRAGLQPARVHDRDPRRHCATHVLRVESVFKKGAFTLQLQMWDARTGKTLSSDGKSCDICTLPTCTRPCATG